MENLYNIKAEQIILGVLILDNEHFDSVDFLQVEYFSDPVHQSIFSHLFELKKVEKKFDSITLKSFFVKDIEDIFEYSAEEFAKIESEKKSKRKGLNYLHQLTSIGAGVVDIIDYAKIIQDLFKKQSIMNLCNNFYKYTKNQVAKIKADDLIENLRRDIDKIEDKTGFNYNIQPTLEVTTKRYLELKIAREEGKTFNENILKTGLFDFDDKFNGLTKKELIILAGRPSMGKTTIANQIAMNVADAGYNSIFFSLETSREQLANKILANKASINSKRLQHNNAYSHELDKIKNSSKIFEKSNYFIDDTYGINCNYIRKCLKRFCRKYEKIDLIVVDYLQIMTPDNPQKDRIKEVGQITNGLKEIAKKFNCAVICLSQLSRSVEMRNDKRPILKDLRESGEIEQITDWAIFCYRDFYYKRRERGVLENEKEKLDRFDNYLKTIEDECDLLVRKNRNGSTGDIKINFEAKFSQVRNLHIKRAIQSHAYKDN